MLKRGYTKQDVAYIKRYKNYEAYRNDVFWHAKFIKNVFKKTSTNEFLKTMLQRNKHLNKNLNKWNK